MLEIEVNDRKIEIAEGSMVMDAANIAGIYIPHFCYHSKLSIAANCRMCLVDVEKAPKALPACATPVSAGMKVYTHSPKAVAAQQAVMEFLLINHPLDCPICDQGGECQLQDLAVGYGKSTSRYQEEKRVVFHKSAGPLIAMEEMTRCIHCTRCVRFGQEIAGNMELGMLGRGEHAQITTFIGNNVNSEISGNMIDLCPVGALTSKPFRYTARTWELENHKFIAPHDSLGSHVKIQTKQGKVYRVLPDDCEEINECWLSDKDRFSYTALASMDRLTAPMIKKHGIWQIVDWQEALETAAKQLQLTLLEYGADAIAAAASCQSTTEELFLMQKLVCALGSDNIDFRLRQQDFSEKPMGAHWLGRKIASVNNLQQVLLIGVTLTQEQPLLAVRLRAATKTGCQIHILHAANDDLGMPIAKKLITPPSEWLHQLILIAIAVADKLDIDAPINFNEYLTRVAIASTINKSSLEIIDEIARQLLSKSSTSNEKAIFMGHLGVSHPQFSLLHQVAYWLATNTNASFGFIGAGANTTGAYLVKAFPKTAGANAVDMFKHPRRAYILLHTEPELDSVNPRIAASALKLADTVIAISAFKSEAILDYAHILLPAAIFAENSGSFINCEGICQNFEAAANPHGQSRPAWKILRMLGNLLQLNGFDYENIQAINDELDNLLPKNLYDNLSNTANINSNIFDNLVQVTAKEFSITNNIKENFVAERIAEVPIYNSDMLVRRSLDLQKTTHSKKSKMAYLPPKMFAELGLEPGQSITFNQIPTEKHSKVSELSMPAALDSGLSESTIRIATAISDTVFLGNISSLIAVRKT